MNDKFLKSLIDKLNANKTHGLFHLRPLTYKVDFAKVWRKKPKATDNIVHADEPHEFYFIKNEDGFFVAAVLDMTQDLHWYVLPNHRRKGYLTNALKEVILYHLFQDRKEQRITIKELEIGSKNFKASENVAKKVGFIKSEKSDNSEYILSIDKYQTDNCFDGRNTELPEERIKELKKEVNYIARSLWLVQTEIEMKLGNSDYTEELKELVDEIKKHILRLEDNWWNSK